MKDNKTKILLLDIETTPVEAYSWGPKYDTNLIEVLEPTRILSFVGKWLGGNFIIKGWPDYKGYKKNKLDDEKIVKDLWKLFDEAEIILGQSSDQFDIKTANARFLAHGLTAPSPYRTLDTKKIAKKYLRLPSYSLDDMCAYLGIGRKIEHEGFGLWKKCMKGDRSAWKRMLNYNKNDVILLEKLYNKLLSYIRNHPNRALIEGNEIACPNCGSKKLQKRGYEYTRVCKYQRWHCQSCSSWSSSRTKEKQEIKVK